MSDEQLFDCPELEGRALQRPVTRIYDIPDESTVIRNDGSWVFVGRRGRDPGWHTISATQLDGTLLTNCGILGYGILGDTDKCVPCPDCLQETVYK